LNPTTRLGYAEGWARVGKLAEARKLALTPVRAGEPLDDMLRALASIAEVDRLTEADQALIERLPAAPWPERRRPLVLYRLARLMADAGQPELAHALAGRIADASLQACARLEAYRGELVAAVAETPAPPETLQKLASAGSAPSGLAQALASHHEARHSKPNVLAQAQAMENPARPFAIAGVALGWQAALPVRGSDSSPSPETR
jgi:hypothetical protein